MSRIVKSILWSLWSCFMILGLSSLAYLGRSNSRLITERHQNYCGKCQAELPVDTSYRKITYFFSGINESFMVKYSGFCENSGEECYVWRSVPREIYFEITNQPNTKDRP